MKKSLKILNENIWIILLLIFGSCLFLFYKQNKVLISFLKKENSSLNQENINLKKEISGLNKVSVNREQKFSKLKELSRSLLLNLELNKIKDGSSIKTKKSMVSLSNNLTLKKYKLNSGFYYGIGGFPGTGYLDFNGDTFLLLSVRGNLLFQSNAGEEIKELKQIKNNINNFIGLKQFQKNRKFSIKDLLIINKKIYVSYTDEIEKDCWNISVLSGNINYKKIKFKKVFSADKCINANNGHGAPENKNQEFEPLQSAGRLISFDENSILLSVGDFRSRDLAQNSDSINGKIIKIDLKNQSYSIISMGHRNPQGLYFDQSNNFILSTEHGPQGGDEVNMISLNNINSNKISNFGWPISSAGEHYGGRNAKNELKYEKYPLHNSHSDYGFIEPLKSFVPSIGISEIVKVNGNKYVFSSLRDKSLYFFNLDLNKEIINLERIEVFERIRDMKFINNNLYLFMEDTSSIGVINLNNKKKS